MIAETPLQTAPPDSTPIEQIIATELSVKKHQIWAAIKLLDSGATVPFIARYRKEATGGLSDTHLRMLADRLDYLRELEARRGEIIDSVEKQGKLNPELKAAFEKAATKAELEDLYLPYRPKRRTKAQAAREAGLEPLAEALMNERKLAPEVLAKPFVDPLKNVLDEAAALAGAREILMEKFSEDARLIGRLRTEYWSAVWITSKAAGQRTDTASKFADYFNFREAVKNIPSHRVLALLRGRQENVLEISMETEVWAENDKQADGRAFISALVTHFGLDDRTRTAYTWLQETARQAWRYKIRIHLELDAMMRLKKEAEEEAIRVFAENLKNLLLAAPAGPRATLGLDPGIRTGVKAAAIDKTGKVLATATIYPFDPQNRRGEAEAVLAAMMKKYAVDLVAIGNGTASRDTDKLVEETLKKNPDITARRVIVSEAGASVYSASELASNELPTLDVSLRGAVSIARRLQDPLAELVKIDPQSIGVGQYQHDVNQKRLGDMLHNVVEDCVNAVGVDLNTASPALLSYVSGLSKKTASSIVAYRDTHGAFGNRAQLLGVPDMGPKAYEQAAGFLRIRGGSNPLDASGVHPEAYTVVERLLACHTQDIVTIMGNGDFLRKLKAEDYTDERFGVPTVQDILAELEKPGRDPRPEFRTAAFKEGVETLDDLKIGMVLEGTVTNVANFGAFVDIGVHQDGLIHISQMSDRFISDPHTVVKTGQIVQVRVVEIDKTRNRVALSLRSKSQK